MRSTILPLVLTTLLSATTVSADNERFWTNSQAGRFQACFQEGHEWYFCTGALAGSWKDYKYKLTLGDGYHVQFSDSGLANITAENGCFKAHCMPRYEGDSGKRECDVITDSPNC